MPARDVSTKLQAGLIGGGWGRCQGGEAATEATPTGPPALGLDPTVIPGRRAAAISGTHTPTEIFDFPGGHRITMTHTCHLRRETLLGRCVYKCSYERESGYVTR